MLDTAPTRVAIAGYGAWGRMHARALAAIPEAALTDVFCHGPASAALAGDDLPGARLHRSYETMLAAGGFDAVIVTVPNDLHAAFAVAALRAGCDVIVEKPLGLSIEECDAVLDAARASGRRVAVDHELRVSHQWGRVREIIAAGEIGRVTHQHFSLFRHPFRPGSGGWRRDPARVGSWLLEEIVHFVDLVLWYARESGPPARLVAQGSGAGLADTLSVMLAWDDGATAIVTQCLAGFEHHTLLEIAGEAGAVRTWWSGAFDRTLTPDFALRVRRRGAEIAETVDVPRSGEAFELEDYLRRALAGFRTGNLPMPPEDARAAVALCLAAERSLVEGGPVSLAGLLSRRAADGP